MCAIDTEDTTESSEVIGKEPTSPATDDHKEKKDREEMILSEGNTGRFIVTTLHKNSFTFRLHSMVSHSEVCYRCSCWPHSETLFVLPPDSVLHKMLKISALDSLVIIICDVDI